MSVAGDLLAAATPTRLLCQQGTWALEVVRFVAVDRNVFQPRTQRVEGNEAILQQLKRGDNATLAASAQQLIRGLRPDEDHALDLVEGEWVPGTAQQHESLSAFDFEPAAPAYDEVASLRAELLMLRATHERLRERVVCLESLVSTIEDQRQRPGTTSTPPSVRHRVEATPSEPQLRLPAVTAVNDCLHAFMGDRVSVREPKTGAPVPASTDSYWVSPLVDDEGAEVGAIVSDPAATATLGGILMILTDEEIAAERKAKAPSQDSIAAMSEVANTLSAIIQRLPGAAHVRVKPIQRVPAGSLDWAKAGKHRLELEVTGGGGRLFLCSR